MATGSKKIRWTITGESAPLGDLQQTWTALNTVVENALGEGLRVEVAEVEVAEVEVEDR